MGTVALHTCKSIVGISLTVHHIAYLHFRHGLDEVIVNGGSHLCSNRLGGTYRQIDIDRQTTVIAAREILGLDSRSHKDKADDKQAEEAENHRFAMGCSPADNVGVTP